MKEWLDGASNELKAVEDRRNGERIELKAATGNWWKNPANSEFPTSRTSSKRLMAQSSKQFLGRRAQELEKRLVVQSRLLNRRESELSIFAARLRSCARLKPICGRHDRD